MPRKGLPAGTVLREDIQVRIRSLPADALPDPPVETVFVRGIQLNTLSGGLEMGVPFFRPVTLRVPLTPEDLAMVEGDPSVLRLLRFNTATQMWKALETQLDVGPPLHLMTTLTGFSFFAVAAPQPQATPTPTPPAALVTPTPSVTLTPSPAPSPTAASPTPPSGPPPRGAGIPFVLVVVAVIAAALASIILVAHRRR